MIDTVHVTESPSSPRLQLVREATALLEADGLLSLRHMAALAGVGEDTMRRHLRWADIRPIGTSWRNRRYTAAAWKAFRSSTTQRRLEAKRAEYNETMRAYFTAAQRKSRSRRKGEA